MWITNQIGIGGPMETERDDPLRGPLMWNRQEDDGEDFRKWNCLSEGKRRGQNQFHVSRRRDVVSLA